MNADPNQLAQLHALLDGTLDPNGEQAVLSLLSSDPAARREFARLAQLHAWLATDDRTRSILSAPAPVQRRCVIFRPAWWLAAAVAAAIILFTASKLWPLPGTGVPLAYAASVRPLLHAACSHCHGDVDKMLSGTTSAGLAMVTPGRPEQSALWIRLSGENACARSLPPGHDLLIRQWIAGGCPGLATS